MWKHGRSRRVPRARVARIWSPREWALRKAGNGVEVHSAAARHEYRHEYPRWTRWTRWTCAIPSVFFRRIAPPMSAPSPEPRGLSSRKDTSCSNPALYYRESALLFFFPHPYRSIGTILPLLSLRYAISITIPFKGRKKGGGGSLKNFKKFWEYDSKYDLVHSILFSRDNAFLLQKLHFSKLCGNEEATKDNFVNNFLPFVWIITGRDAD